VKTSTQLKAKARNLSAATGAPPFVIQRHWLFERFLERMTVSEHRNDFVIKGGMLLTSIVGIGNRFTMDLDSTIQNRDILFNEVPKIISDVIAIKLDDGVEFQSIKFEPAQVESDYSEWRFHLDSSFGKIRQSLKLDVTLGGVITPRAVEYDYKLLFEDRQLNLMAYNLETVLAEKFSAFITLGETNTRMKDYYDAYMLAQMPERDIDREVFALALKRTAEHRDIDLSRFREVFKLANASTNIPKLWEKFQVQHFYAADISLADTIKAWQTLAEWAGLDVE
jgi:predicted nucleotidyltransferase component of viral defense system